MLEQASRKWARYVSKGSRSVGTSVALFVSGLFYALLHVFQIVDSETLFWLSVLAMYMAFNQFERAGLLMLMDELRPERSEKPGQ